LALLLKALALIGAGGGVMSLITSGLVGADWPGQAKGLIALLICIIGSFVMLLGTGMPMDNLVAVIPTLWIAGHLFYVTWFKPRGIAPWIEQLFLHRKSTSQSLPPVSYAELETVAQFEDPETGQDMVTIQDPDGHTWTRPSKLMQIYMMGYGGAFPLLRRDRRGRAEPIRGSSSPGPRAALHTKRCSGRS
jgi:hypothetical protein